MPEEMPTPKKSLKELEREKKQLENKEQDVYKRQVPDGDAVGSSLAMYMGLKQLGKEVDVIIPKYSKTFEFLPCANEIKDEGKNENYDLAIALAVSYTHLKVQVKLFKPFNGQKQYEGILKDYSETIISLETQNGIFEIERQNIGQIKTMFDWN